MTLELADELVRRYLTDPPGDERGYQPLGGSDLGGTEVVRGLVYRYYQQRGADDVVLLQLFLGLGDLGGQLWDQQVRALTSVGSLGHQALPRIVEGRYLDSDRLLRAHGLHDGFGYIRTKADEDEGSGPLAPYFRARPAEAMRQFWYLAEALAALHDNQIVHRNVWPGSLGFGGSETGIQVKFERFEMSAVLASLQFAARLTTSANAPLRELYLSQGSQSLLYSPPERLRSVLDGERDLTGPAGDVFGLGMLVAGWFLDDPHFDVENDEGFEALTTRQAEIRRLLDRSRSIPRELGSLLRDMTAPKPQDRPLGHEALQRIAAMYGGALEQLAPRPGDQPYLLMFQQQYTDTTLYKWGVITDSATTDTGTRQVRELLTDDLRGALVVSVEGGANDYFSGDPDSLRAANTVIFGQEFVWFCGTYYRMSAGGPQDYDTVQLVRYVVPRGANRLVNAKLEPLARSAFVRTLPPCEILSDRIAGRLLTEKVKGRPSWPEFLKTVVEPDPVPESHTKFLAAVDFLLQYQRARLEARCYAFRTVQTAGAKAVLSFDSLRDGGRRNAGALGNKLVGSRSRPEFADFFSEESEDETTGEIRIEVLLDDNGSPSRSGWESYPLVETTGTTQITVQTFGRRALPEQGWVRLASDGASWAAIRRQSAARIELEADRKLMTELLGTQTLSSRLPRSISVTDRLSGEGPAAVLDVLASETLYALQGPPGTGKTEVTSEAVVAHLRANPHSRILVAAQSHDALDNLAGRIVDKLAAAETDEMARDWIALRMATRATHGRVAERVQPLLMNEQAPSYMRKVRGRLEARRRDAALPTAQLEVLSSWLAQLPDALYELALRLRRGANLVFVTCGAATPQTLITNGSSDKFDWVLVEEAAKAWPTELAMPLVRGRRWTLIGDQAQIGAFELDSIERFLGDLANDPDPELQEHAKARAEYREAFRLFASVFDRRKPTGGARQLTEQYRMRSPIAEVVGRAFYPVVRIVPDEYGSGGVLPETSLVTRRQEVDHGLVDPPWLQDQALVWVDTHGVHGDTGYWWNPIERDLVGRIARTIAPKLRRPKGAGHLPLAILTPYREQVRELSKITEFASSVFTVDSFQGREADVVILSLVRDTHYSDTNPARNLGHLLDPARVNVALSRARDLLIVVGRFDHFADSEVEHWETITRSVRRFGCLRRDRGDV